MARAKATETENATTTGGEPTAKGVVFVKSKTRRGFWRCGLQFTSEGRRIDLASLKPGDLERLRNEPNLVVTDVQDEGKK